MLLLRRAILTVLVLLAATSLLCLAVLYWPLPPPAPSSLDDDVLLANVNIIDVRDGVVRPNMDVRLSGGVIQSVSQHDPQQTASLSGEDTPRRIDGEGHYMMPGLWDLHTHSTKLAEHYYHPLLLAHGVTAVREMWGCMDHDDPYLSCPSDRRAWDTAAATGARGAALFRPEQLHGQRRIGSPGQRRRVLPRRGCHADARVAGFLGR